MEFLNKPLRFSKCPLMAKSYEQCVKYFPFLFSDFMVPIAVWYHPPKALRASSVIRSDIFLVVISAVNGCPLA